jgi:hypothetical protein
MISAMGDPQKRLLAVVASSDARTALGEHNIAQCHELCDGPFRLGLSDDRVLVIEYIAGTARKDEISHILIIGFPDAKAPRFAGRNHVIDRQQ